MKWFSAKQQKNQTKHELKTQPKKQKQGTKED